LKQYKDMEKTPVNLVRRGVNRYWFEDTLKEIISVFYTAAWCVCVCHQHEITQSFCIGISISYPWFTDSDREDEARLTFVN
jgi:hypothetical protein